MSTQYPITTAFKKEMAEYPNLPLVEEAAEVIGEYEHGTADVEDVAPGMTLELYVAALTDFLLTLTSHEEYGK
jgi:hypothetical protein